MQKVQRVKMASVIVCYCQSIESMNLQTGLYSHLVNNPINSVIMSICNCFTSISTLYNGHHVTLSLVLNNINNKAFRMISIIVFFFYNTYLCINMKFCISGTLHAHLFISRAYYLGQIYDPSVSDSGIIIIQTCDK